MALRGVCFQTGRYHSRLAQKALFHSPEPAFWPGAGTFVAAGGCGCEAETIGTCTARSQHERSGFFDGSVSVSVYDCGRAPSRRLCASLSRMMMTKLAHATVQQMVDDDPCSSISTSREDLSTSRNLAYSGVVYSAKSALNSHLQFSPVLAARC